MDSKITSVLGYLLPGDIGIVDSHNHVWVEAVSGTKLTNPPVLDQYEKILSELKDYKEAGGDTIVDCQSSGCGRNGNVLVKLSRASGVAIIACTGFH